MDIAVCLTGTNRGNISAENVAAFLIDKAHARGVSVSRAAFHNPEIWERAGRDYAALASFAREAFIPFDDARSQILQFVQLLAIPDN